MKKACISLWLFLTLLKIGYSRPPEESAYWGEDKEICVKELKLKRGKIKAFDEQEIVTEEDPQFNLFAQCFFIRSGIQDLNGKILYDKIKQLYEEKIDQSFDYINTEKTKLIKQIAFNAVDECENTLPSYADNAGQLAVRVGNCIMNYLRNIGQQQMSESAYDTMR